MAAIFQARVIMTQTHHTATVVAVSIALNFRLREGVPIKKLVGIFWMGLETLSNQEIVNPQHSTAHLQKMGAIGSGCMMSVEMVGMALLLE